MLFNSQLEATCTMINARGDLQTDASVQENKAALRLVYGTSVK